MERDELLWPEADIVGAAGILSHARKHFPAVMEFLKFRGRAIQAGGNVGVYPIHLARWFDEVHTFEPELENFRCLELNTRGNRKIHASNLCLGDGVSIDLKQAVPGNCGTFRPEAGKSMQTTRIDDLDLGAVDLIWLDVEGYETEVLRGARETIRRDRPALIFESIGLGDPPRVLAESMGYKYATRIKNDDVMLPC